MKNKINFKDKGRSSLNNENLFSDVIYAKKRGGMSFLANYKKYENKLFK